MDPTRRFEHCLCRNLRLRRLRLLRRLIAVEHIANATDGKRAAAECREVNGKALLEHFTRKQMYHPVWTLAVNL